MVCDPKRGFSLDPRLAIIPAPMPPVAASQRTSVLTPDARALLERRARRLRRMSVIATTEAGSGHPSTCLSAADLVAVLFFREMRLSVADANDPANDRLVLSKGHAAPLLYAAWAQLGVLKEEELGTLRRLTSPLEGHPTPNFPRSEAATGSLGQGLSIGLGMAVANRLDKSQGRTFVLLGDGEMAEGSVWEAASLAALIKADRLVALVDVNGLGQSQRTARGHDTAWYARVFEAFGWRAVEVDGHDLDAVAQALESTRQSDGRPVALLARTLKGQGISWMADQDNWHGKPVPADKLASALAELGMGEDGSKPLPVHVPATPTPCQPSPKAGTLETDPPYKTGEKVATRNAYGAALARLGAADARIMGLDGDTKNSTMSLDFMKAFPDRFVECFIAEQNMVGVAVGLAARGRVPFGSTFAAFLTRAYDFVRMAAVGKANLKLCGSHCGVSIGEDGASQMGLEDLAMMRAVSGSVVLYPSDAVSTERLVREAAGHDGVVYLRSTRPAVPVLYPASERFPLGGSKLLKSSPEDKVTVVAAGITLHEALAAHAELAKAGIPVRVIDAYSVKPLDAVGIAKSLSATAGKLVVAEDHYPEGGLGEAVMGALPAQVKAFRHLAVRGMPRSGAPAELLARHGLDAKAIVKAVRELVSAT